MKCISLILVFACIILMPSAVQAAEKPVVTYSFDNIQGDTVPDLSGFGNDGTLEGVTSRYANPPLELLATYDAVSQAIDERFGT